jgi:DNA-binding HxlR family transcriptional regulator
LGEVDELGQQTGKTHHHRTELARTVSVNRSSRGRNAGMTEPEPEPWEFLKPFVDRKLAAKVLHAFEDGPQRYTDALKRVTLMARYFVHPQTFNATLRWLCDEGYIAHREKPNPVYGLTEDGQDLVQILTDIERVYRRRRGDGPDSQ